MPLESTLTETGWGTRGDSGSVRGRLRAFQPAYTPRPPRDNRGLSHASPNRLNTKQLIRCAREAPCSLRHATCTSLRLAGVAAFQSGQNNGRMQRLAGKRCEENKTPDAKTWQSRATRRSGLSGNIALRRATGGHALVRGIAGSTPSPTEAADFGCVRALRAVDGGAKRGGIEPRRDISPAGRSAARRTRGSVCGATQGRSPDRTAEDS